MNMQKLQDSPKQASDAPFVVAVTVVGSLLMVGIYALLMNWHTTYKIEETYSVYAQTTMYTVSCSRKWTIGSYAKEFLAVKNPLLPGVNEALSKAKAEDAYNELIKSKCHPYDQMTSIVKEKVE